MGFEVDFIGQGPEDVFFDGIGDHLLKLVGEALVVEDGDIAESMFVEVVEEGRVP